ncbi:hypothetical protein LDENG_00252840 [Lucifuga dentata]|nr:hypothetical protein LDENG_00252840 [Lucifuga dentata]
MQDSPAFVCGLTFCYRLGLSWTILLVAPLVITSAFCPRLRFQSLRLDSLFDCVSVGTLSCQFFCLPLCWTESSIKELYLLELYCVLHLGPNPTRHNSSSVFFSFNFFFLNVVMVHLSALRHTASRL